jgi:glycerophosphoryl diester phosphodiesterase
MPLDQRAFLDDSGPIAFAHRGGAKEGPQNTMVAFQRAIDLGYRYLETDASITADGVLVAFHDSALDEITDSAGRIDELPWSEVSKARVEGEPIPRLEDILAAWPEARVNIDLKSEATVVPVVALLEHMTAYKRVCIGSFSEGRLGRFRHLTGNQVCTSMGRIAVARLRLASWGLPVGGYKAACVQVPLHQGWVPLVDHKFLDAAHRRGLPVHVWTIDDRGEMERLLDLGVDGIMTDRPTVLKDVLVERGQWT